MASDVGALLGAVLELTRELDPERLRDRVPGLVADALGADAVVLGPPHASSGPGELGVPIEGARGRLGTLHVRGGPSGVTDEQAALARALAAQIGVAMDNARTIEELQDRNDAKTDFVSTVAHELRSPVTALTGLSQTLHRFRDGLTPEEVTESLAAIDRQAGRLNRLVGQLLDLSRLDSGRQPIEAGSVAVRPIVVRAVDVVVEAEAPPDEVSIDVAVEQDTVVHADPDRLDQVLVNLIGNAVRHGGPTIRVTVEPAPGGGAEVVVADDGPGVPEGLEAELFERFTRGKDPGGSGLGLAISRALMEAMGGTLAHHRRDGWTTFVAALPAGEGPAAPA